MADPLRSPRDTDARRNRPRWVVPVVTVVAIAVLGLLVVLHLSGTIGPGIH